jgi:hypothetical protein
MGTEAQDEIAKLKEMAAKARAEAATLAKVCIQKKDYCPVLSCHLI